MTPDSSIDRLIARARRRWLLELAAEQFLWGLAAALAAFSALLVLGTQVLAWYWPPLLLIVTVGVGVWRSLKRIPGEYQVARRLDAAFRLRDLLATAWHFRGAAQAGADPALVAVVECRADAAATHAAKRAPAWKTPLSGWFALALAIVASGLFAVRYGVLRSFDARAPIVEVRFDTLTGAPQPLKKNPTEQARRLPLPAPLSLDLPDDDRSQVTEREDALRESLRTVDGKEPSQLTRDGQKGQQSAASDDGTSEENEESDTPGGAKNAPAGAKDGQRPSGEPPRDKQGKAEKDSLLDKMRDALANLMDKLKIEQKGDSQQTAASKNGQKGAGQKDKGAPQPGRPDQRGEPDSNQQGEQPGEGEQAAQARANQQGGAKDDPSNQEKSGIGRQDGKKDIELAEQQKAMGKLSELLGKRSLNLQGEVMVEVTNSKNQQLKTPYVNRNAAHQEAGGEVSRDEVPLDRRQFVERYYEQVRRPAAQPAKP